MSSEITRDSFILCVITADVAGCENDKMFSHIPRVIAEEVSNEDDDDDDANDNPDDMVAGDGFDPFESDCD